MATTEQAARALAAAEAIAAEGKPVTMRAVKARAAVATDVAAAAAREWNDEQAALVAVPDAPSAWVSRLDALWPLAYGEARATFSDERAGLLTRVERAETERDEVTAELAAVESERDTLKTKATHIENQLAAAQEQTGTLARDLAASQAQTNKANAIIAELRNQLAAAQEQTIKAESRADKANASLDAALKAIQTQNK